MVTITATDVAALASAMQFDHVIEIRHVGDVAEIVDRSDVYAPELFESELPNGWDFASAGYTGQQGGGNIMHDSEYIGGRLAQDILSEPGVYVAVVNNYCDGDMEGWAIAKQNENDMPPTVNYGSGDWASVFCQTWNANRL